jgi:hypothetical protein
MYEHRDKPLLPRKKFYHRLLNNFFWSAMIVIFSLMVGMVGYHWIGKTSWIDGFYNAAMILTGMGPVNVMESDAAKIFASFYAIFSGVVFLTTVAILMAPVVHRFMHKFHLRE